MRSTSSLLMVFIVMFVLTIGTFTSGRAAPQTALMPAETINIAHFFKPPGMDAASAANAFNTIVLTGGDHNYRNQLSANGFSSTVPQYFRADGIQNPGSCTATPLNNQVAYRPGDFCFISQNHPDWFLLDSSGQRITVTSGGDYYRMDPANEGWRSFFVSRVIESQTEYGWSGLFLDNVEGGLSKFYGPRPVRYPDNASYQNAIAGFLNYLKVNYSQEYGRPMIGNIVARADDPVWFSYLQHLNGAMQERFAVDWDETDYLDTEDWEEDLAFMEQTQAIGKYVILVAPGNQNDLNRQSFAFASYLLISNGKAAFRYSTDDVYREVWLYDNYRLDLGSPLGPRYRSGSLWRRDFANGCVVVDPTNHHAAISSTTRTDADILIGGALMSTCSVSNSSGQSQRVEYPGANNGPVKITGSNNELIVASQRVLFGGMSYSEMMGLPAEQLTNDYLFPYYNNVAMDSQLRVSNLGSAATTITVYLAGQEIDRYTLSGGQATRKNYPNHNSGPLRVTSSATDILTTIRVLYGGKSYSEMMGYPAEQLTDEYLFPYYNNVAMDSQLRVSNLGDIPTTITVYLGTQQIDRYTLGPGGASRKNYPGQNSGPLRVVSSSTDILTTLRVLYGGRSYSELMGYPANQLAQEYWYPVYDNASLDSQLRVSNIGGGNTTIRVYLGAQEIDSYSLTAGAASRKNYPANTGPLRVVSSSQPILTTVRLLYNTPSFASLYEMTGLPGPQLSTQYFFPWYNNIAMSSELRFALP